MNNTNQTSILLPMNLVDINDLEYWSGQVESKFDLPLLISRLIRCTANSTISLQIPKGRSIYRGGWDGIVETKEATEFVPSGLSLWEFGTENNPGSKAQRDYEKRILNSLGYELAEATFVFVTTRTWEKNGEWIQEKLAEKKFKDIKVIDGAVLVEWLMTSPLQSQEVFSWIGKKALSGISSLSQLWADWSIGPKNMKLTAKTITAGREGLAKKVFGFLESEKEVITIQSTSKEESLIFLIGAVLELENDIREDFLSKSIVVDDFNDFKLLTTIGKSLLIIPKFNNLGAFRTAISQGHRIVLPLGIDDKVETGQNVVLGRIDREQILIELQSLGLSEEEARLLSKNSSRNINVIRRILKFDGTRPEWAKWQYGKDILPALLAGSWDESKDGDRLVLEILAGETYEKYIEKLTPWLVTQDPPIQHIGTKWRLTSPLDSWTYLSQYISKHQLDSLSDCFNFACSEIKPALSLEADKRYLASFFGKIPDFSIKIREGLLQSLSLIGIYGDVYQLPLTKPNQLWVDSLILNLCNKHDPNLWKSLDDILPSIAEASPSGFLKSLEEFLATEPEKLEQIFEEAYSPLFSNHYHTGMLWALEALAWMPNLLGRISLALLELDALEQDVKIQNSPINTLASLFLNWMPQTSASLSERKDVMNSIKRKRPDFAWRFCEILLPAFSNTSASFNHRFRWRPSDARPSTGASYSDIFEFTKFMIGYCISLCGSDPVRITKLLTGIQDLAPTDRKLIISFLEKSKKDFPNGNELICKKLRGILHYSNASKKIERKLTKPEMAKVSSLYEYFSPRDVTGSLLWIFDDHWPKFPDGKIERLAFGEMENYMQKKRNEALAKIYSDLPYEDFLSLSGKVKYPNIFGFTAAFLNLRPNEVIQFCSLVESEEKAVQDAGKAYISRKYFDLGLTRIKTLFKNFSSQCTDNGKLRFLTSLRSEFPVWKFVEKLGKELAEQYWKNCEANFWSKEIDHQKYQIVKLTEVKRHYSCMHILSHTRDSYPTELIISILNNIAFDKSEDIIRFDQMEAKYLFDEIYTRDDYDQIELAKIEWPFIFVLKSSVRGNQHLVLHKELSKNPEFFVQVLSFIYQSEMEDRNVEEIKGLEQKFVENRAKSALQLLDGWKLVPGTTIDEEGKTILNETFLTEWVENARRIAKEVGRLKKADLFIGKILGRYPEESENWPPDAIAEIIEAVGTRELCTNFHITISNKRSFSSRGPYDGGRRERGLADYFKKLAAHHLLLHPKTAEILSDISESYAYRAHEEDNEALENDLDY